MPTNSSFYDPSSAPYLDPSTDRQVVFITGANSGIGWFDALHLYLHGYIVYIGGRTESKVLKAIEDLKQEAQKRHDNKHPLGELHYQYIDLLDLSTVVLAAKEFSAREPKLHKLILNAGIMALPYELSKDDIEIQYQVNVVGHFLLTHKLAPQLEAALEDGHVPRVVHVASVGHYAAFKYFHPGKPVQRGPDLVSTWVRYGVSKSANIQIARLLAKKYPKILSVAVHPGLVVDTELYNRWKNFSYIGVFTKGALTAANSVIGVTLEQGALSTLKAALDPSLTVANDNGKYLTTGGNEGRANHVATNENNAIQTWDWNVEQLKARGLW
ncbi:NAD(P)-binding protein [Suhomyces tanzawaensis NRRL Y-17324]|uniref:NAD(P)-binding protein n=1 Tax=Suhomyces tanzawaensis NRRL Y-17324 TaxID=984487 RepID=A0A1E4SDI8_9ASCO|nr:NAD(P)-binding protein [Suhomyces tanzawaensis NRRL Y-17324]ODV77580.1 NAD(P)-binding protein [Suhomyces tanzawaensis NRRL Y-17324]